MPLVEAPAQSGASASAGSASTAPCINQSYGDFSSSMLATSASTQLVG